MANTKEIKTRIESVKDTRKITNAMYLIASTKLRKARNDLDPHAPVFRGAAHGDQAYLPYPERRGQPLFLSPRGRAAAGGHYACLVITADKGLAGRIQPERHQGSYAHAR